MTSEPTTEDRRRRRRKAAVVLIAAGSIGVAASGVYAVLQATAFNTTPQAVGSGTLRLTMAANGNGISATTPISDMAPGDVVNRFIALTNGGTLDGQSLTMKVADATPTALSTDAVRGLQVRVDECDGAWTPGTNSCAGTVTTVVADQPLAGLGTDVAVGNGLMTAGQTRNLRLTLRLADSTETTVNGALPTGTIQGLSAALTWTFTEAQRTATTTSS